jgi:phosphate uptake regulator
MTRREAQLELELLERALVEHGDAVLAALRRALEAFRAGDPALPGTGTALRLRAAHDRIDAAASRLLAERWEISADARRAVAARRVNDELEGAAELALALARLAQPAGAAAVRASRELDKLGQIAQVALHEALRAYAICSVGRAAAVAEYDAMAEEALAEVAAALAARAALAPEAAEATLRGMLAARLLRRASGRALRIAAQVGFVATGTRPAGRPGCTGSRCPES